MLPEREAGFSLVEVVVAMSIVGAVVASLSVFMVDTLRVSRAQRDHRVAVQVADDAMERVRALQDEVLAGRTAHAVDAQWRQPVDGVGAYLTGMDPAYQDPDVEAPGAAALLPTDSMGQRKQVNGVAYRQHWYLGWCWQAAPGRPCDTTARTGVRFLRVVVAVTWPPQGCPRSCSYVTSTLLVGRHDDPVFAPAGQAAP